MRDFLLVGAIACFLAFAIKRPFAGLIVWAWFTIMTPHQMAYGAYGIPLNTVIAGVTLLAYFASGEISKFKFDPVTFLLITFAGWLTIAQAFSLDAENSAPYFDRFIKTLLFIVLCVQMTDTRLKLHALLWILVAGIGFFAAKGAIFTALTLGQYHVFGPPDTVLEDNNHLGIATATILPLILYLATQAKQTWLRYALLMLFCLSVFEILGTQSRGGFIALGVFGLIYWFYSKRKLLIALGFIAIAGPALLFMPSTWFERMATISEATEDASFMGRVDAWIINWKLAKANPVTGAGLRNSYEYDIAATVDPERSTRARAAHSIYFEVLGSTGFVGLFLYLSLVAAAFAALQRSASLAPKATFHWTAGLAKALQVSLVVFCVGGASVSMEMWDGYLVVIALAAALRRLSAKDTNSIPAGNQFRTNLRLRTTL